MANLFFIHTPFQLFVAQQLIHQEKSVDNIMLYGFVGSNSQNLEAYNLMTIPEFWKERILMENVAEWAVHEKRHPIKSSKKILDRYNCIINILRNNNIDTVFLSDINNFSQKFLARILHDKGVRIVFFEEGTSNYNFNNNPRNRLRWKNLFIAFIFDYTFFLPKFGFRFAHWRFVEDQPLDMVPIDEWYNIIPNPLAKDKSKRLRIEKLFSNRLKSFIEEQLFDIGDSIKNTLYVSSPYYDVYYEKNDKYGITLRVLRNYIIKEHITSLFVKYHPRDHKDFKIKFEQMLEVLNVRYFIISSEVNIPMEYYLQYLAFKKIVCIYSSVGIYNGYIYDKTEVDYLLKDFYEECCKRKVANLESLLKTIENSVLVQND